jgi:hypothetical protein
MGHTAAYEFSLSNKQAHALLFQGQIKNIAFNSMQKCYQHLLLTPAVMLPPINIEEGFM